MDVQSLALLLKQTLEPGTRAEAEANLDKVSKIIGFAPGILQVKGLSILPLISLNNIFIFEMLQYVSSLGNVLNFICPIYLPINPWTYYEK